MEIVRQKNVATIIVFPIVDADGDLVTGAAGLDSEIDTFADGSNPDGFTDCTNEATEIGSTGMYYLSLTQSEMNADYIVIQVKTSTSGAKTQVILIRTMVGDPLNIGTNTSGRELSVDANNRAGVDVQAISGDTTAADNLESYCDGTTPQPVNATQIAGSTVATGSAQLGVNVVNWKGAAAPDMTGDAYARLGAPAGVSVSADIAAVKSDTGEILTDTGTTLPGTLSSIAGYIDTEVASILAAVDTEVAAILADTNELQTDWANGGRLDLLIDSIIATLGLAGAGLTGVPWNAAWDAEVQSECADALAAYDPPTNAEMEARTIAAADYATAANLATVDTVVDAIKVTTDKLDDTLELDTDVYRFTENAMEQAPSGTGASASAIADAVWDELLSGHTDAGSAGAGLSAAGSAGDPWSTALPGSYGSGTAGKIIGDNLNATVSSRASQTSVDTIDGIVDSILEDTGTTIPGQISGLNNLSAQQVWEYATRVLTAATNLSIPSAADIKTAIEASGSHLALILEDTGTTIPGLLSTIDSIVDAILEDTGTSLPASLTAIAEYIDTEIAAILEDTGDTIPGLIGALHNISVDDVLDEAVEGSITLRQALRGIMSVLFGQSTGGGTATLSYRDQADTKARVTATADENGNRSAVTLDLD